MSNVIINDVEPNELGDPTGNRRNLENIVQTLHELNDVLISVEKAIAVLQSE